jgi:hypothetical protein
MADEGAHRLDKAGNEVMTMLQLHVDIGESRVAAFVQRHQAVVG